MQSVLWMIRLMTRSKTVRLFLTITILYFVYISRGHIYYNVYISMGNTLRKPSRKKSAVFFNIVQTGGGVAGHSHVKNYVVNFV